MRNPTQEFSRYFILKPIWIKKPCTIISVRALFRSDTKKGNCLTVFFKFTICHLNIISSPCTFSLHSTNRMPLEGKLRKRLQGKTLEINAEIRTYKKGKQTMEYYVVIGNNAPIRIKQSNAT